MIVVTDTEQCTILILGIRELVTSTKAINKDMEKLSNIAVYSMRENGAQVQLTENL